MTSSQITKILNDIGGYACDSDIPLNEVSSIYLTTDGCLYPDNNTRFNFKKIESGGILLVYKGYTETDGSFVKEDIPSAFVDFSVIAGFTLASEKNMVRPYSIGKAV